MAARRRIRQLLTIIIIEFLLASGSYEILSFPADSRALSVSNAASAYDQYVLRNNPATLTNTSSNIIYSYFNLPANIQYGMIQILKQNENHVNVNKVSLLNYGKLIDGSTNKTHSAYDLLFSIGYKKEYKHITSLGMSINYLISSIASYHSNILYANFGVRSRANNNRFGLGLSLENFKINANYFSNYDDIIPTIIRGALYYKPLYFPATIHLETKGYLYENCNQNSLSFESIVKNNIIIRMGSGWHKFNEIKQITKNISNNFSLGLGINFKNINLDVGYKNLTSSDYIIGFSIKTVIN